MRSLYYINVIVCLILFVACKEKTKITEDSIERETETIIDGWSESAIDNEKVKDCDEFLDRYEKWMEEYVDFLTEYKDNPVDMISDPRYGKILGFTSTWLSDWSVIALSCSANPFYEKRFKEISQRMERETKSLRK